MTAQPEAGPLFAALTAGGPQEALAPWLALAAAAVLGLAAAVARRRSWPVSFRRALLFLLLLCAIAAAAPLLPPSLLARARPWLLVCAQLLAWLGAVELAQGILFDLLLGGLLRRPPVPRILRDFLTILLGLAGLFLILRGSLGVNLTSLLATSAMLSVVLGLALQDTLGSFFSGLALQMEKPFAIGDWIQVGEHRGQVTQNAWRAVRIVTLEGDEVTLPNAAVARAVLVNYSRPTDAHLHFVTVRAPLDHPPRRVLEALVEAARGVPGVLPDPPPSALLWEHGASEVLYRARFWIGDYRQVNPIASEVATRIWYRLRREGVATPFPVRELRRTAGAAEGEADPERVARALGALDILAPLAPAELALLARRVRPQRYDRGERIVSQGEPGDSLFVVTRGTVQVRVSEGGAEGVVGELPAGSVFGEMSLLTGEARAATVAALAETEVLPVSRADFRRIVAANPAVLEAVTRVVLERGARLAETVRETGAAAAARAEHADLLSRVRAFFHV